MKPGDKVFVMYEGWGIILDIDKYTGICHVKIDSDGVIVAASLKHVFTSDPN